MASVPLIPSGKDPEDPVETTRMTFGEHLDELRTRLLRAVAATILALIVTSIFAPDLMHVVLGPYQSVMNELHLDPTLKATGPTQGFVTYFKISLMAAVALAAPIWLHQMWAFIAAGLYERERKPVRRYFPLSVLLFVGGTLFGYFALLPIGLRYLMTFADEDLIQNWTGISEYLSLFFTLTLLLGVTFELPMVMLGLAKAGLVTSKTFRAKRKLVILGIFIVAGIVTPPDPITQSLVAIPLCGLFELGIIGAFAAEGGKREPIVWKKAWGKLKWAVAAVVLLVVFWGRISAAYREIRADAKLEEPKSRSSISWQDVAQSTLRAEPDGAFRVRETGGDTWFAVSGGGRAAVLRFRKSAERSVTARTDSRNFTVLSAPPGAVVWHCDLPTDLRNEDVVAPLIEALESGGAATKAEVRRVLSAATGLTLDSDDLRAVETARAWLSAHADAPFAQPPL